MRRLLFAGLLLPALAFAAPPQNLPTSHACRMHAGKILGALQNGSYDAAGIAHFDAAMKQAISAQMNQFWSLLAAYYGGFEHAGAAESHTSGNQQNPILPLIFAHGRENLHVTCDATGNVIGLFLTPAGNSKSGQ